MNKTNILIFIFLLLGTVSCTPLSEGLTMKSEVYNADNVDFYYDLTYKKDGETHYERQIWEQAYDILDKAEDFFLMDIFLLSWERCQGKAAAFTDCRGVCTENP